MQAIVQRYGFCSFRLLAHRPPGAPPELEVRCDHKVIGLTESGDDNWYEVETDEPAGSFTGLLLTHASKGSQHLCWQLSSRDLHVLALQQGFPGPTSTARLALGRKQLVLCRASVSADVQSLLTKAGCGTLPPFGTYHGAPAGWVFFWPAVPTESLAAVAGEDMLNLLRPQPDLEVTLEGGIWLFDNTWLAGYPPVVLIAGPLPPQEQVHIDGNPAAQASDGGYSAPHYDDPGKHQVWCAGKTKTYAILSPEAGPQPWDAHSFPMGTVCGARSTPRRDPAWKAVTVPASNPVLVGARPGEVFHCPPQPGIQWTGFVPFEVAWALPEDPLHCDRARCRVIQVSPIPVSRMKSLPRSKKDRALHRRWAHAIGDCRRKGLTVSPADAATGLQWRSYLAQARATHRAINHPVARPEGIAVRKPRGKTALARAKSAGC